MSDVVVDWYDRLYDEQSRLPENSLEYVRVKEIISRYLTSEPMAIADVGGGTGAYSFWLAEMGHHVSLVDLTPRHIDQARAQADSTGVSLSDYCCADARRLPYEDEAFDLVLEMGPLYHLQPPDDRRDVLREAYRVLKPGHHVLCQVISRWASLIDGFKHGFVKDDYFHAIMKRDMQTGCHANPEEKDEYFTTAYFHRPDEIVDELAQAGFTDINLVAVEGFAAPLEARTLMADPAEATVLLECLDATESVPELMGISSHIMAIGARKLRYYAPK